MLYFKISTNFLLFYSIYQSIYYSDISIYLSIYTFLSIFPILFNLKNQHFFLTKIYQIWLFFKNLSKKIIPKKNYSGDATCNDTGEFTYIVTAVSLTKIPFTCPRSRVLSFLLGCVDMR